MVHKVFHLPGGARRSLVAPSLTLLILFVKTLSLAKVRINMDCEKDAYLMRVFSLAAVTKSDSRMPLQPCTTRHDSPLNLVLHPRTVTASLVENELKCATTGNTYARYQCH